MTPDLIYDQLIGVGLRAQADLLLGRQPRRRLAAPLPRRGRERLAAAAGARGAQPRRHGQPLRGGRLRPAVRGPARLPRHRPRRAHTTRSRTIDCPFTGEQLAAVAALDPDVAVIHAQQADRHGQRAALGPGRRPEGGRAGAERVARHRRGDRRRARAAARRASSCRPGRSTRRRARCPAARTPPTPHGYSARDNDFYQAWDAIARDRDALHATG